MAKDLGKYQAGVGRLQGANEFYMKSDGFFQFYTEEYTGEQLMNMLVSRHTVTHHPLVGSVISVTAFSPPYGYHVFSLATDASLCSMALPSAKKGMYLVMDGIAMAGDANVSVSVPADQTLVDQQSVILSSFELSAVGYIELIAKADDSWAIVGINVDFEPHTIV